MEEVTLNGRQIRLKLPESLTTRRDVVMASIHNLERSFGAALGLAWQGRGKPKADYGFCKFDPLRYGGMVIDELVSRGIPLDDVLAAARIAYSLFAGAFIDEEAVEDAEDFSEDGGAMTSPRSQ